MSHSGHSQDGGEDHIEQHPLQDDDNEQIPPANEDDIIYLDDEELEAMD
jgi:hypothetical protein